MPTKAEFSFRCPRWHVEASRSLGLVTFRARSNRRRGRFFLSLDVLPELRDRILNFKKSQTRLFFADDTSFRFRPGCLAPCPSCRCPDILFFAPSKRVSAVLA
ncbi:hypothetical protein TGMAS_259835 [Toxoplasma gondii MAS]|uniref:Uncharacterized protein n=1 Tax=Toxoplasma gondii MAS TaxID=943118 RepID=A0A086QRF7_TOXGO|nr:hypothetical protein TGMAS_259835 [Toxoplasma gondii MAS]